MAIDIEKKDVEEEEDRIRKQHPAESEWIQNSGEKQGKEELLLRYKETAREKEESLFFLTC